MYDGAVGPGVLICLVKCPVDDGLDHADRHWFSEHHGDIYLLAQPHPERSGSKGADLDFLGSSWIDEFLDAAEIISVVKAKVGDCMLS